nr:uncharacterized protein LOC129266961 [Lytechinus pictus]
MQGKESKPYSQNDVKFLKRMKEGINKDKGGQCEMPLPLTDENLSLPNNRFLAEKKLSHLKKRFQRDPEYHTLYNENMTSLFDNNYAEIVTNQGDEGKVWYIPHHGVHQPGKLRVVIDCSAQFKGKSLNDHLLTGPDLTNTLTGVLCRFRLENHAFMCDVKEMFHRFRVNPEHRNFLRFLWWPNGDCDQEPVECRMNVHLFGAVSSPGCANFALKQIAADNAEQFGEEAAEFIRRDFYVDDGLKSVTDEDKAIESIANTRKICEQGGLHLHKFVSNSRKVLQSVPAEDRSKDVKELNLLRDPLPIEKALGVQRCIQSDSFQFRITLTDKPATRRGVLSTIMSVYDPLGLLAPVILSGKQILQELCRSSSDWDDPLDDVLKVKWEKWRMDILQVERLSIKRCFKPSDFGGVRNVQLHHFSDASSTGYGHCTYIRVMNADEKVHCALVMGKSRVAPLKPITIPRLELTAAVVSVRISSFLQKELKLMAADQYFWTDSRLYSATLRTKTRGSMCSWRTG